MTTKKLILFIFIPLCLIFTSVSFARNAAILIDATSGRVLFEQDASQPWYPASLTKLMTLYMTFDALRAGHIQLQDNLIASYHVSQQPNSKLGMRVGQSITVEEAILAVITRSANDAAVILSEYIGGSEAGFAAQMTHKAHSLGMSDSQFRNATGLPDNLQVTTAKDMAILAWRARRDFPEYYPYFATHSFVYNGRELLGINKFTANYPGAEGMKTGFTCGSGFNLIGSASQQDLHLIGVILGGATSAGRYQLMIDMMDAGFGNQLNDNGNQHVTTMPASSGGTPPYVLNCGKGAFRQSVSHESDDPVYEKKARIISTGRSRHKLVTRHKTINSNAGKHPATHKNKTVNSKVVTKAKPVSKPKSSAKASVAKANGAKRTTVASKSIGASKTRYRRAGQH